MQHADVRFLRSKSDTPQLCLSHSAKITTGIALVGASLIAVTPVATPLPDVQHRQFRLTGYDEFDLSQLASANEPNRPGLATVRRPPRPPPPHPPRQRAPPHAHPRRRPQRIGPARP